MSKKPFKDKNSYENYVAHLNQLSLEAKATYKQLNQLLLSNNDRLNLLGKTAAARFRFFDAFHDRYDITDELFGATIVPVALGLAGIASALLALWETGHMLAIKAGLVRNDHKEHGEAAVNYFLAAVAASATIFLALFKSVVSLATRTAFTLLDGWKKPTKDRFSKESAFSQVGTKLMDLTEQYMEPGVEGDFESEPDEREHLGFGGMHRS